MDPNTIAAVVSAAIAVVSAVVGAYFARRSVLYAHRATELQEKATKLQERATQLQYFAELRVWAGEAVDMFSDAVHLRGGDRRVFNSPDFLRQKQRLLCRLSAHLDRGRWFFPNVSREPQGPEKEAKFGGFRHEVVQTLHRAYRVVRSMEFTCPEDNRVQCHDLRELQRYFVQQIQEVLNPANFDAEFREIVCPKDGGSRQPKAEPPEPSRSYDYLDEDAIAPPPSVASADHRSASGSRVVEDMDERIYGEGDFGPPEGDDPFAGEAGGFPAGRPPTTPPKG